MSAEIISGTDIRKTILDELKTEVEKFCSSLDIGKSN